MNELLLALQNLPQETLQLPGPPCADRCQHTRFPVCPVQRVDGRRLVDLLMPVKHQRTIHALRIFKG